MLKSKTLIKRLLAMALATVMLLGCFESVFAARQTLPAEDVEALDISHLELNPVSDDDDVYMLRQSPTALNVIATVGWFHATKPSYKLHAFFGIDGVDDSGKGTKVILLDDDIKENSNISAFQFNKDTNKFESVRNFSRHDGYLKFTLKRNDFVAIASPKVMVSYITISPKFKKGVFTLARGKSKTLTAKVTPKNADNKAVKWTISNKKVATIKTLSSGKCKVTVKKTAKKKQTAVIKATAKDGSKVYAYVSVKVK